MNLQDLANASDDELRHALWCGDVTDSCLLDRSAWERIEMVSRQMLRDDTTKKIRKRRYAAYIALPEHLVVSQLKLELVPPDVLANPECWMFICKVRGRNPGVIPPEVWKSICKDRGEKGVPAGPYNQRDRLDR